MSLLNTTNRRPTVSINSAPQLVPHNDEVNRRGCTHYGFKAFGCQLIVISEWLDEFAAGSRDASIKVLAYTEVHRLGHHTESGIRVAFEKRVGSARSGVE